MSYAKEDTPLFRLADWAGTQYQHHNNNQENDDK